MRTCALQFSKGVSKVADLALDLLSLFSYAYH
jgi:hypothetical protein